MIKINKKTAIYLILLFFYLLNYNFLFFYNTEKIDFKFLLNEHNEIKKLKHVNRNKSKSINYQPKEKIIDYCEISDEWTDVNGEFFFRINTAKYYIDKNKLVIFFICRKNGTFNYKFVLHINMIYKSQKYFNRIENTNLQKFLDINGYEDYALSAQFYLNNMTDVRNIDYKMLQMSISAEVIHIKNAKNITQTKYLIVDVRYFRNKFNKNSKNAVICIEPLFFEPKEYKDFEWYIELNKLIGYDKIVIYNNSIPNTEHFNRIFRNNKDFIDLYQFQCLPNFINNSSKYLRHYKDFITGGWGRSTKNYMYLGFDSMANNECYHQYANKAKLILIQDNDETFIAPKLKLFEKPSQVIDFFKPEKLF